jgi:hypothetical protein
MFSKSFVYTIVTCILLSSCAPIKAYPGPELPPEQLATVTFDGTSQHIKLSNMQVDETSNSLFSGNLPTSSFSILPGKHHIQFHYENRELVCFNVCTVYYGECYVDLTATAGHTYYTQVKGLNSTIEIEVYKDHLGDRIGYIRCRD